MLFQSFDSGEEFEDHEEDQDEAGQDDGVDVALDTDDGSEDVTEIREEDDRGHATPDDDADAELEDSLVVLALQEVAYALVEHDTGQDQDNDLIQLESVEVHRDRYLRNKVPNYFVERLESVPEALFLDFPHGIVSVADFDGHLLVF